MSVRMVESRKDLAWRAWRTWKQLVGGGADDERKTKGGREEQTLRTTLTLAAPDPSSGATASTTRIMSRCIMRM